MSVVHKLITLLDQVSLLLCECLLLFLTLFCSYVKHLIVTYLIQDTWPKHCSYRIIYLMYVSMAR
jgi:hypothetical protein